MIKILHKPKRMRRLITPQCDVRANACVGMGVRVCVSDFPEGITKIIYNIIRSVHDEAV